MNRSALLVAEVPPAVVTVMSTVPAVPAGSVAVMLPLLLTTKEAAAFEPKSTAVALARLVPLIVTDVPPAVDPWLGVTPVTVGLGRM